MTPPILTAAPTAPPILLVGQPNVGKSALFGALTGMHANVSNYPGTTVTMARGRWQIDQNQVLELLDTPGAYSLLPVTEEERVTRDALFAHPISVVLFVVEARNLDRALATALELKEAGLPLILVLNMWDEAQRQGISIDVETLQQRMQCPVVSTVAIKGTGLDRLQACVLQLLEQQSAADPEPVAKPSEFWRQQFGPSVQSLAGKIAADAELPECLPAEMAAVLAIRGSKDLAERAGIGSEDLKQARLEVAAYVGGMPPVAAILALRERAAVVCNGVFVRKRKPSETFQHRLGLILAHPVWGMPVLVAVLYLGFYQLVGVLAADKLVGFLEETVFGGWLMPHVKDAVNTTIPWQPLRDLLVGQYGILSLGITYALALVLPVVGAFFIIFSLVEDSGYFPRLAMLCDRLFKKVGLNGRAVITMVLGLGCSTMATVTTRTLESRRDRVLANLLLVLTIPCAAQLGLITALLGSRSFSLWALYVGCLVLLFMVVGMLAARLLPGRNATFHMELVPMRMPKISNVLRKTWRRLYWYFEEVVPLFLYASVLLWLLDLRNASLFGHYMEGGEEMAANALHWVKLGVEPVMTFIGQPLEAAESFLIGFFRRDFGAAGLYLLNESGNLGEAGVAMTDRQILVGSYTMTLFVPCIATFMMMVKERGGSVATAIFVAVTVIAVLAGALLNQCLLLFNWQ